MYCFIFIFFHNNKNIPKKNKETKNNQHETLSKTQLPNGPIRDKEKLCNIVELYSFKPIKIQEIWIFTGLLISLF